MVSIYFDVIAKNEAKARGISPDIPFAGGEKRKNKISAVIIYDSEFVGALKIFASTKFETKQTEKTVTREKSKNNGGKARLPMKDTINAQIIRSISP